MITTQVLDAVAGRPAPGIRVQLLHAGEVVAWGVTDVDGHVADLGPEALPHGAYQLHFDTSAYSTFFPEVTIAFVVSDDGHHHVPLVLSPFGYSTYRDRS